MDYVHVNDHNNHGTAVHIIIQSSRRHHVSLPVNQTSSDLRRQGHSPARRGGGRHCVGDDVRRVVRDVRTSRWARR